MIIISLLRFVIFFVCHSAILICSSSLFWFRAFYFLFSVLGMLSSRLLHLLSPMPWDTLPQISIWCFLTPLVTFSVRPSLSNVDSPLPLAPCFLSLLYFCPWHSSPLAILYILFVYCKFLSVTLSNSLIIYWNLIVFIKLGRIDIFPVFTDFI